MADNKKLPLPNIHDLNATLKLIEISRFTRGQSTVGAVIVLTSVLDEAITNTLTSVLVYDIKIETGEDLLFSGHKSVNNLGTKISLLHRVGLVSREFRDLLRRVVDTRNLIAHDSIEVLKEVETSKFKQAAGYLFGAVREELLDALRDQGLLVEKPSATQKFVAVLEIVITEIMLIPKDIQRINAHPKEKHLLR